MWNVRWEEGGGIFYVNSTLVALWRKTNHASISAFQDIITHQLPMTDVVKGINLVNKSSESIKVVLIP